MRRSTIFAVLAATVAMSALVPRATATERVLIADNPTIEFKGFPQDQIGDDFWFRCDATEFGFIFTGIKTDLITGTHVLVDLNLAVTNHKNGDKGLDGLVNITVNPGKDPKHTFTMANVLLDNIDPTNLVIPWDNAGGTYASRGGILVHKDYIQNGELHIQVQRIADPTCDFEPAAPKDTQAPIDVSTCPPTVPSGYYENNNPKTVHVGVRSTDKIHADSGEVTISTVSGLQVVGDTPTMDWAEKVSPPDRVNNTEWHRDPNSGVQLTFTGINTAAILGTHVLVNFNLYVTNRPDGDGGLDGLVEVTVNPKETDDPKLTYTVGEVLLDNIDPNNVLVHWGKPGGTYAAVGGILVHKDYIQNGELQLQISRRQKGVVNRTAENGTQQPIDMSKPCPTVPPGIYGNDDAHTVHFGINSADGIVADPGEVVILAEPSVLVACDAECKDGTINQVSLKNPTKDACRFECNDFCATHGGVFSCYLKGQNVKGNCDVECKDATTSHVAMPDRKACWNHCVDTCVDFDQVHLCQFKGEKILTNIPAVTSWGLLVMVLLVLAAGTVVIRRWKTVQAGT